MPSDHHARDALEKLAISVLSASLTHITARLFLHVCNEELLCDARHLACMSAALHESSMCVLCTYQTETHCYWGENVPAVAMRVAAWTCTEHAYIYVCCCLQESCCVMRCTLPGPASCAGWTCRSTGAWCCQGTSQSWPSCCTLLAGCRGSACSIQVGAWQQQRSSALQCG
jgi:hypothetical protein